MSGFEALGMACSVFQTISFAHETARLCRDVYRGRKTPDSTLEENATAMIQAADQVKASCRAATTPEEQCLIHVAKKCRKAATKLSGEVQKITKLHRKGHLFVAVRSGVRYLWKRSEINDLDDSLRRYTKTMQTLLINRVCTQVRVGELKQRQDFRDLDQKLQAFILQIDAGHTKMKNLLKVEGVITRDHVTNETTRAVESVNARITNEAKRQEMREVTANQRERFLQSLRFQEMNQRKNAILDPEDATFNGIFQSFKSTVNGKKTSSGRINHINLVWQSFIDWLQSDKPLFWIQGKPGSGKSTLIRYIISNKTTQTLLDQRNPNTRILSHFFWKIGTPLQSSSKGLYCFLLYQLLRDDQRLVSFAINESSPATSKESHHDWSVRELERVLLATLKLAIGERPLCIFIDGLDEYASDDGQESLVRRIRTLTQFGRVKVCVASRPETRLRNRLDTVPNLKLHDLTEPDMRTWVQRQLSEFEREGQLPTELSSRLAERLLRKAEGVFLWLRLATQSVIRGIQNKDLEYLLVSRLEQLPDTLEDLYADMWKRLSEDEPIYRASAATYLRYIIGPWEPRIRRFDNFTQLRLGCMEEPSLLHIVCARHPEIQKRLLTMPINESVYDELEAICDRTENNIRTQCAGLIEARSREPSSIVPPEMKKHRVWKMVKRVDFIHRTAHEFLVDTEAGQRILSHSTLSHLEISFSMLKGALCWLRLLSHTFDASYDAMDAVSGLTWLPNVQEGRRDSIGRGMELMSIIQSLYEEGILYSEYPRWPQTPFLAHMAKFQPLFVPALRSVSATSATTILQELPWRLMIPPLQYFSVKALRILISHGADPVAITSYARRPEGLGSLPWHGMRITALWSLLDNFYTVNWCYGDITPHATAAAAVMLEMCSAPMVELWGIISPLQIDSDGEASQCAFTLSKSPWIVPGKVRIRPVLEVNVAFLLQCLLGYLPSHDRLRLKSEVQLIRSRIKNPTACVRFIAYERGASTIKWFRVINQQPLQGFIPLILATVIGTYEKASSNKASFKEWFELVVSLMQDNNALEGVQLADVARAPAIEERLGPCRLEDVGFTYSDEMKELARGHPWLSIWSP